MYLRYGPAGTDRIAQETARGQVGSVRVHESAINALIARQNLAGLTLTDRQLQRLLTLAGANAGGEQQPDDSTDLTLPKLYSVTFAEQDPFRVQLQPDGGMLVLRMSIRPVIGLPMKTQEVRLPITAALEDSDVVLKFGKPQVRPADGSPAGIAQTLIAGQIATMAQPRRLPASGEIPVGSSRQLAVRLSRIQVSEGWLLLAID